MAVEPINVPDMYPLHSKYAQIVRVGKMVFVSGALGLTPEDELPGDGGFEAQVHEAFENLRRSLRAAGARMENVVKVNAYVVGQENHHTWRRIRGEQFGDHLPASTGVVVSGLADPEYLFEIEAIAVID